MLLLYLLLLPLISPRLIQLYEYSRHGARSPENYHNPSVFPEGKKKITAEGLYQHYLIGTELRQRYINNLKFLPPTIGPDSLEVKVYASSLVRTFSSAASQLMGLYPDNTAPELQLNDLEKIFPPLNLSIETQEPIFSIKTNKTPATLHGIGILMINQIHSREDLFFQGFEKTFCPKVAKTVEKLARNKENQRVLNHWKKTFLPEVCRIIERDWNFTLNPDNLTFESVKDIYDLWVSLDFHKRGYELHFDNKSILDYLKEAYIYVMYFQFEQEPLALKASMSLLVEDIVLKMTMKIKGTDIPEFQNLKFVFYSGRDRQINGFLEILMEKREIKKLKKGGAIDFASVFLIELHEEDDNKNSHYVKIWLNDVALKMKCGEEVGVCEFGRFLDVLKSAVSDNIYRDCGSDTYRYLIE